MGMHDATTNSTTGTRPATDLFRHHDLLSFRKATIPTIARSGAFVDFVKNAAAADRPTPSAVPGPGASSDTFSKASTTKE